MNIKSLHLTERGELSVPVAVMSCLCVLQYPEQALRKLYKATYPKTLPITQDISCNMSV